MAESNRLTVIPYHLCELNDAMSNSSVAARLFPNMFIYVVGSTKSDQLKNIVWVTSAMSGQNMNSYLEPKGYT